MRHRRHYRRNPSLMGITLPPLDAVLFTGAGLVIPPIMASYLTPLLPASLSGSKMGYYGVKVASILIPSMLVRKFVSQRAGNYMLIGGAASLAIDLVKEFMPSLGLGTQPFLGNGVGFYERMPLRTMSATPGMGRYASIPVRSMPMQRTPIISQVADRLNPTERF